MGRVLKRWTVLALVLAPLVALHIGYHPGQGPFSLDGSYYVQAARFVAEQNRLLTGVSLYHEGLAPLPGPWFIYPLWPLLLGVAAKLIGLVAAANVLPQLFYVLDLILFALLASRMAPDVRYEIFDVGHLAALVAGLNFIFFEATIYPYTEGLAMALGLGSLLLLERRPGWAGVLAGLSCLARYQMVALPIASAVALVMAPHPPLRFAQGHLLPASGEKENRFSLAPRQRGEGGRRPGEGRFFVAGLYSLAVTLIVLPWILYARTLFHLRVGIPYWDEWVHAPFLGQLVRGLAVAVNPFSRASLWISFGAAVVLVPLMLFAKLRLTVTQVATGLTGILSIVMLAHFESKRLDHWLFGERHALLFIFAVVAALAVCLAQGRPLVRWLALAAAGIAILQGVHTIVMTPTPPGEGPYRSERALVGWLSKNAPHAAVLTTNAQPLSVYARNPFHWTDCGVAPETTKVMLRKLPIEYVVVYANERDCAFIRGLDLRPVAKFDDPVVPLYLFGATR
jgi:hypothetical protein